MTEQILPKSAVLQRRSSVSDLQAVLDGVVVTGLCYLLIARHIGALTAQYTAFVFLLLCTLGLLYDAFGIYRRNASFTRKALDLLQAWSLTFFILLALGFATRQTESFSRLLLGQLFLLGYVYQALLHLLVRMLFREVLKHSAEPNNAIIVGTGALALFLNQHLHANEWLGQRVVGLVRLQGGDDVGAAHATSFGPAAPCLGRLEQLLELIEQHRVRTIYFAVPL